MENHHFQWENPLWITIFNSYAKLPEPEGIFHVGWIGCISIPPATCRMDSLQPLVSLWGSSSQKKIVENKHGSHPISWNINHHIHHITYHVLTKKTEYVLMFLDISWWFLKPSFLLLDIPTVMLDIPTVMALYQFQVLITLL